MGTVPGMSSLFTPLAIGSATVDGTQTEAEALAASVTTHDSTSVTPHESTYVEPTANNHVEMIRFVTPGLFASPPDGMQSNPGSPPPPSDSGSSGSSGNGIPPERFYLGQPLRLAGSIEEIEQSILSLKRGEEVLTAIATDTALIEASLDESSGAIRQVEYYRDFLRGLHASVKERESNGAQVIKAIHHVAMNIREITRRSASSDKELARAASYARLPLLRVADLMERRILYSNLLSDGIAKQLVEIYAVGIDLDTLASDNSIESGSEIEEGERAEFLLPMGAIRILQLTSLARRYANLEMFDEIESTRLALDEVKFCCGMMGNGEEWALGFLPQFLREKAKAATSPGIDSGERKNREDVIGFFLALMMQGTYPFSETLSKAATDILDEYGMDEVAGKMRGRTELEPLLAERINLGRGN